MKYKSLVVYISILKNISHASNKTMMQLRDNYPKVGFAKPLALHRCYLGFVTIKSWYICPQT